MIEKWTDENGRSWSYVRVDGGAVISHGVVELPKATLEMQKRPAVTPAPTGIFSLPSKINGMPLVGIGICGMAGCDQIQELTIPEGVEFIAEYAFANCRQLRSVHIPPSVTGVAKMAFAYCAELKSLHIQDLSAWTRMNQKYTQSSNTVWFKCPGHDIYVGGNLLESVRVDHVESLVEAVVFGNCRSIKQVAFGTGVKKVESTFPDCPNLQQCSLPDSVEEIGFRTFYNCPLLRKLDFSGKHLKRLSASAFENAPSELVEVENGLRYYKGWCLGAADELFVRRPPVVRMRDGTIGVAGTAFTGHSFIETMIVPPSVECVEPLAFHNMIRLRKIYFEGRMPAMRGAILNRNCDMFSPAVKIYVLKDVWGGVGMQKGVQGRGVNVFAVTSFEM